MNDISLSFDPLRIYISSSWQGDLEDENMTIIKVIKSLYLNPYTGDLGSDAPTKLHSSVRVKKSDIVVLILGEKYSEHVEGEYYEALENDIPVLAFIKDNVKRQPKLEQFIENLKANLTYIKFTELKDFKKKINENLMNLISDSFRDYQYVAKTFVGLVENLKLKVPKKVLDKLKKLRP